MSAKRGLFFAWRKAMNEMEMDRDILAQTLWDEAWGD
jgi:hypothetical protein